MKQLTTFIFLISSILVFSQDHIYVHTANPANTTGHITAIDHPELNGNPGANIIVTHAWNPNGLPFAYNDNITGVWYNGSQWTIYNEDTSVPMVDGSHYFVYITSGGLVITHIASAGNVGLDPSFTVIDEPSLNGNPNPKLALTTRYGPNAVYNDHNYGFFYEGGANKWNIYSESGVAIPTDAAFNVLVQGAGITTHRHQALASNITGASTLIDNASLNGNPNATFVISHYWGILPGSQINMDKVLGVWYSGTNWGVYIEGGSDMPEGIVFDINVASQSLAVESFEAVEVSVYPNPTNDSVTISANAQIDNITIYNILGQEIKNISVGDISSIIDMTDVSSGAYIAKVHSGNATEALKIIKQ